MTTIFTRLAHTALAAAALCLASCDDTCFQAPLPQPVEVLPNTLYYGGQQYPIAYGDQWNYGDYYMSGTENISLGIHCAGEYGPVLYFDTLLPEGHTWLEAHSFTYGTARGVPYSFGLGEYSNLDINGNKYFFTGGMFEAGLDGDIYTLDFDITLESGKRVYGNFTGPLNRYSSSNEE